jgi:hypothetical protein
MTQELLELETGFWNAAGDGSFYREHMARDGLMVLPVGVLDRDATIDAVDDADPWEEVAMTDVTTLDLGDDEAALCYRAQAKRADDGEYVALISSVYTRIGGEWKLNLHQQTPIDDV